MQAPRGVKWRPPGKMPPPPLSLPCGRHCLYFGRRLAGPPPSAPSCLGACPVCHGRMSPGASVARAWPPVGAPQCVWELARALPAWGWRLGWGSDHGGVPDSRGLGTRGSQGSSHNLSWSWGRPEPWLQNRPRRLEPPGTRRAVTHRTRPCERLPWTPTHGGLPQAFQCFLLCGQSLSHSAAFRVQSRPAHTLRPQESLVPNLVLPPASPLPPPRRPHALPEPLVLQPALRPSSGMDPVAFLSRVPLISAVPEPESHKVAILGHAGP